MRTRKAQLNPLGTQFNSTTNPVTVGNTVREARKAKGWSQAKLAGEIGVTPAFITQLEDGKTYPGTEKAILIASKLGLDEELFLVQINTEKDDKKLKREETRARSTLQRMLRNPSLDQHSLNILTARRQLAEIGISENLTEEEVIIKITERIFGSK